MARKAPRYTPEFIKEKKRIWLRWIKEKFIELNSKGVIEDISFLNN